MNELYASFTNSVGISKFTFTNCPLLSLEITTLSPAGRWYSLPDTFWRSKPTSPEATVAYTCCHSLSQPGRMPEVCKFMFTLY